MIHKVSPCESRTHLKAAADRKMPLNELLLVPKFERWRLGYQIAVTSFSESV